MRTTETTIIDVDADKGDRIGRALHPHFEPDERDDLEFDLVLPADDVAHLVAMGPSAHHVDPTEVRRRIAALAPPVRATASMEVSVYRPR